MSGGFIVRPFLAPAACLLPPVEHKEKHTLFDYFRLLKMVSR